MTTTTELAEAVARLPYTDKRVLEDVARQRGKDDVLRPVFRWLHTCCYLDPSDVTDPEVTGALDNELTGILADLTAGGRHLLAGKAGQLRNEAGAGGRHEMAEMWNRLFIVCRESTEAGEHLRRMVDDGPPAEIIPDDEDE